MERQKQNQTRVYVPGAFDCLHPGHLNLLERARELADIVIAGVDTDEFITLVKSCPPIFKLSARVRMLKACRFVDEVVINWGGPDSKPAILQANPNFILHGDDYPEDEYLKKLGISKDWLLQKNIKLYLLPYTQGISSFSIKKRMQLLT